MYLTTTRTYIMFVVGLISIFVEYSKKVSLGSCKGDLKICFMNSKLGILYSIVLDFRLTSYVDIEFVSNKVQ